MRVGHRMHSRRSFLDQQDIRNRIWWILTCMGITRATNVRVHYPRGGV